MYSAGVSLQAQKKKTNAGDWSGKLSAYQQLSTGIGKLWWTKTVLVGHQWWLLPGLKIVIWCSLSAQHTVGIVNTVLTVYHSFLWGIYPSVISCDSLGLSIRLPVPTRTSHGVVTWSRLASHNRHPSASMIGLEWTCDPSWANQSFPESTLIYTRAGGEKVLEG